MVNRDDSIAEEIARGVSRLLIDMGYSPITELTLNTGRRVDVAGLNRKGNFVFVEIKSGLADYRADQKWQDYLDYCDDFYFAVNQDFPTDILPSDVGLIIADRYGAEIIRQVNKPPAHGSRRRAALIRFARTAAKRFYDAQED